MKQKLYITLNKCIKIKRRIAELIAMKDSMIINLIPSGISYDKDKVMTSPEDLLSKIMANVSEIEDEIKILDQKMISAKKEVESTIHLLDDSTMRIVLTYWYIGDMDKNDIASILGYDRTSVYKIHDRAIEELEKRF